MIHATFPAAVLTAGEASGQTRTVAGVAVPWDVEGQVSDGRKVRFARGSLDVTARPLLLRDHDRGRPLGRVTDATDADAGMLVSASVSRTRDGDEALVLAADGILGDFSVGVNPTAHHYEDDVLVVDAGEWQELSLLTFGAFPGAAVATVAAASGPEIDVPIDPDEDEDPEDPDEEEEEPDVSTTTTDLVPAVAAGAPAVLPLAAAGDRPEPPVLTLRNVATMVAGANRGETGLNAQAITAQLGAARIQAATSTTGALENITTANVTGFVRPGYLSEVRGLITRSRATIDHIRNEPLPESGKTIEYPRWVTQPLVDIQAVEKTAIPTGPVLIDVGNAPVVTFATGNDISLQAVERSSPSFMEAYLQAAAAAYARRTNQYAVAELLGVANVVPPPTTPTWLNIWPALYAGLDPNLTPAGRIFVGMSQDVATTMLGVSVNNGPAFWTGSIDLGGMPTEQTAGGMSMYVDWDFPAKTIMIGSSNGAGWHENAGAPADIRVVDVSLLGVDVGVYGYGAIVIDYPEAFAKMTFVTLPAFDEPAATSSSRSKS